MAVSIVQEQELEPLPLGDPPPELARWMAEGLSRIKAYTDGEPFRAMLTELAGMTRHSREQFVQHVLLNESELAARGLAPPSGLTIQRSEFYDGRPTLFCVSSYLPPNGIWRRVTYTYDHDFGQGAGREHNH
jgi:hypothetical protein